jgi:hypothetical protein
MAWHRALGLCTVNGISIDGRLLIPALLATVAALVGGCGGDDGGGDSGAATTSRSTATTAPAPKPALKGPRPAEPAEQAVTRLAKAAAAGDCSAPEKLFGTHSGITPALCKKLLPTVDLAVPPEVKTYGSGAVAGTNDGGSAILALDSDRRFKFVTSFAADLNLPKAPVKNAAATMTAVVGAIRRDSCREIVRYSLTYSNGGSGNKFCALRPIRDLHTALNRAYSASPKLLGGDRTFAFYGLDVKPHHYTLVFLASKNGSYYFVTSARA